MSTNKEALSVVISARISSNASERISKVQRYLNWKAKKHNMNMHAERPDAIRQIINDGLPVIETEMEKMGFGADNA